MTWIARQRIIGTISIFSFLTASGAIAQQLPRDRELKDRLIGIWTAAPDDGDKNVGLLLNRGVHVVERFKADGTGTATAYVGAQCRKELTSSNFVWSVKDQVLLSQLDGHLDQDRILDINATSLHMYSLDRREFEHSVRGLCP